MATWLKKSLLAGLILCLLPAAAFAIRVIQADWAYFRAEKALVLFQGGRRPLSFDKRDVAYLHSAEAAIQQALDAWSDNPRYLTLAAQIHVWRGHYLATSQGMVDIERDHYNQALDMLRKALRLNPTRAQTWALLAEYKTLTGQRDAEWHRAKEKALELGGADIDLVERMLSL